MQTFLKSIFLTALTLCLAAGCKKESEPEPETPEIPVEKPVLIECEACGEAEELLRKPFFGQWKEIERGSDDMFDELPEGITEFPTFTASGDTVEFLPEGVLLCSRYQSQFCYSVDTEFLYRTRNDAPGNDAPPGNDFTDRYTFTGSDTLRLDYVDGAIKDIWPQITFRVYKRIKD
jgi:hypothetical protein